MIAEQQVTLIREISTGWWDLHGDRLTAFQLVNLTDLFSSATV
jgi:hypothetical protein